MKYLFFLTLYATASAQDFVQLSEVLKEVPNQKDLVDTLLDRFSVLDSGQLNRFRGEVRDKQWKMVDSFPGITIAALGSNAAMAAPKSKDLGDALIFGDELDPKLMPLHDDSVKLAMLLNQPVPEKLLADLQASGHTVEIRDSRYFANFGNLKYKGRDVLTPVWIDTGIPIPGQKRNLLVPATRSQLEIFVNGPKYHAALRFFIGVDQKAIVRPIDTIDQAWVRGHTAHVYRDRQAVEAMQIIGELIQIYAAQSLSPLSNAPNAIIEFKLNGKTTLYPLMLDKSLFANQADLLGIVNKLPNDEIATDKARVIASLPVAEIKQIPLANLRADLMIVRSATSEPGSISPWLLLGFLPLLIGGYLIWRSFSKASR